MKIKDFIEILKTFPPEDHPKFWCAQEQRYYWFIGTLTYLHGRCIIIDIEQPSTQKSYQNYEYLINILSFNEKNNNVIFIQNYDHKSTYIALYQDNRQTATSPSP